MKQFLYLDTDIVNSIIAQAEKGIITQRTIEASETKNKNRRKLFSPKANASAGGFWKFVEAKAQLEMTGEFEGVILNGQASKDVIEKVLHDAAFDEACKYIEIHDVKEGIQDFNKEGNYLKLWRELTFIDLDYLENIFQIGEGSTQMKELSKEQIEKKVFESTNRKQRRDNKDKFNQLLDETIEKSAGQIDMLNSMIRLLKRLIPYKRLLLSKDGYIIPADDKFFRIDPKCMGFKYGGSITCIGMLTNLIGEDFNPTDNDNVFEKIQFSAHEALRDLLPTKEKNLCVIHPIAIYYGE